MIFGLRMRTYHLANLPVVLFMFFKVSTFFDSIGAARERELTERRWKPNLKVSRMSIVTTTMTTINGDATTTIVIMLMLLTTTMTMTR